LDNDRFGLGGNPTGHVRRGAAIAGACGDYPCHAVTSYTRKDAAGETVNHARGSPTT
jgi:hypothetical protein